MKIFIILSLAILTLTTPLQANAKPESGTGMAVLNALKESEISETYTEFFLMGLSSGLLNTLNLIDSKVGCMPEGSSNQQHAMVIRKYLEENPKELHKPIYLIAFDAFIEAYPCEE